MKNEFITSSMRNIQRQKNIYEENSKLKKMWINVNGVVLMVRQKKKKRKKIKYMIRIKFNFFHSFIFLCFVIKLKRKLNCGKYDIVSSVC